MGNPLQSYGTSLAIWDHTMLPATRHKWTCPAITPANQACTRFTYPGGMEGWVVLRSLIAVRPGIKPTTARSQVRHPNRYATESPHLCYHVAEISWCCYPVVIIIIIIVRQIPGVIITVLFQKMHLSPSPLGKLIVILAAIWHNDAWCFLLMFV